MEATKEKTAAPATTEAAKVPATTGTKKPQLLVEQEAYVNALTASLGDMDISYSTYQKVCAINVIQAMKEMMDKEGLKFKDMNQDNINKILQMVSMLQLNIAATPRECYLQFRYVKNKATGEYHKEFEFGVEGAGNDKIIRTFGVGVKDLKGPFIVREGDDFTYPYFDGEKMMPPTWTPKSYYKKPIRVFYIVIKEDGTKEFLISERESVVHNLQAHITNNMMKESDEAKAKMVDHIANMTLDELLADKDARQFISPAWFNPQSRDAMIETKMRNNATKKYPKDFRNAFIEVAYEDTYEDYDQYRKPATKPDPMNAVAAEYEEKAQSEPVAAEAIEVAVNSSVQAQTSVNEAEIGPQTGVPVNKDVATEEDPY